MPSLTDFPFFMGLHSDDQSRPLAWLSFGDPSVTAWIHWMLQKLGKEALQEGDSFWLIGRLEGDKISGGLVVSTEVPEGKSGGDYFKVRLYWEEGQLKVGKQVMLGDLDLSGDSLDESYFCV